MVNVVNIKSERERVFFSEADGAGGWLYGCGVSGAELNIPGGGGSVMRAVLRRGYRSNRGHFEGSEKIGGVTQTIPCYSSCGCLKEPLKTLRMLRLERRWHRNMAAVVSDCDSLWTSTQKLQGNRL